MGRRIELPLTDKEKEDLQWLANHLGVSVNQLINDSLLRAIENNSAGVYDHNE